MASTNALDPVALTALIVSLVALTVALGQLLGQYFATADGHRRCQSSVMGPWSKHTKLRWRWQEFRFETLYAVPKIGYTNVAYFKNGEFEFCSDHSLDPSLKGPYSDRGELSG